MIGCSRLEASEADRRHPRPSSPELGTGRSRVGELGPWRHTAPHHTKGLSEMSETLPPS